MSINIKLKNKAFTLVELLVVISIIGVLSTTVFATLNSARAKARDARRKSDLSQIAKALEVNYLKNGTYTQPENCNIDRSIGATGSGCVIDGATTNWDSGSDLRQIVTDGSINKLPIDPINVSPYYYEYEPSNLDQNAIGASKPGSPAGAQYYLCANQLESTGSSFCLYGNYP